MRANALLGLLGSIALAAICALGAACIIIEDDDDDRASCERNGRRYRVGEIFPAGDGCNTCECRRGGEYACTLRACVPDAGAPTHCEYNGQRYQLGEIFEAGDGCNTCECRLDGQYACSLQYCPAVVCEHRGTYYRVGDTFPAGDGCNTCTCSASDMPFGDATVGCTLQECSDAGP